jgi:hypothetical protein
LSPHPIHRPARAGIAGSRGEHGSAPVIAGCTAFAYREFRGRTAELKYA